MRLIDVDALPSGRVEWDDILEAPTVDAVPVRHGKWMPREEGCVYPFWERYTCSVCGKHADDTDYCPHCGARMVKDDQTN